jgi:hypothetical protein
MPAISTAVSAAKFTKIVYKSYLEAFALPLCEEIAADKKHAQNTSAKQNIDRLRSELAELKAAGY